MVCGEAIESVVHSSYFLWVDVERYSSFERYGHESLVGGLLIVSRYAIQSL